MQVSDPPLHGRGNFLDSQVELDRRLLDYIVGLDTEISELVDGSVSNSMPSLSRYTVQQLTNNYMYMYMLASFFLPSHLSI